MAQKSYTKKLVLVVEDCEEDTLEFLRGVLEKFLAEKSLNGEVTISDMEKKALEYDEEILRYG